MDLDQMEKQLEFLIARGVQWFGFGFGSEVNRLSPSNLSATVSHIVRVAGGRVGVIGNAEMTSIEKGLDEARRAKEGGADLAMVRPSGLVGVSQELFAAIEGQPWNGERGQALALLSRALPLMELGKRDLDTFLFVQKYVLLRRGVLSSTFLGRPHGDLDPSLPREIDELLDEMGLLELFEEGGPTT